MMMRFKEAPDQSMMTPGTGEKIMHATLRIGDSTVMASDGRCMGKAIFQGISLSLTIRKPRRRQSDCSTHWLTAVQIQMALAQTFFSPAFGMVADKFSVPWMVYVATNSKPWAP